MQFRNFPWKENIPATEADKEKRQNKIKKLKKMLTELTESRGYFYHARRFSCLKAIPALFNNESQEFPLLP